MTGTGPIGGYFGLDPAERGRAWPWLPEALAFQSARAAIAAFFHAHRATAVWAPFFVCGAVREALAHAGTQVIGYPLDARRGVSDDVAPGPGEWVLCVDYFGLSGDACDAAIARFGADRVVVDASQALLHAPRPGVATVYSPRKFCGVPDGGLLVNAPGVSAPPPADEAASIERSASLKLRAAGEMQAGYARFLAAEESLADCAPTAMSHLTRGLFEAIDSDRVRTRRIDNYLRLAGSIGRAGLPVQPLPADAVPLCCPVAWRDAALMRTALAGRGIFTPGYWPDADVPAHDATGLSLRHGTIYLPCDQRYDADDMDRIASTLFELGESA